MYRFKTSKSWKAKQKDKLSKQDQILNALNIQVGSVNTVQNVEPSSDTKIVNQEVKSEEKKEKEVVKEEKKEKKIEKCDKEKKSLCKGWWHALEEPE